MSSVITETKSFVTQIILNNPEKGNVVNDDNLMLLKKFITEANNSDNCRVIVLRGKDKVFSRGMDFSNMIKHSDGLKEDFSRPYLDAVLAIRNSSKPVIAAIDGDVLAGGMGLMLASDIIIATKNSIFGLSEVLFGLIPALVFPLLLERVTLKKARYLILSSKRIGAEDALSIGMVDEVVEDDKFERKLKEYYKRLLYSSPDALSLVKSYSDKISDSKIEEKLDIANKQLTKLLQDKKNVDAIKDFIEGEKLPWAVKYSSK